MTDVTELMKCRGCGKYLGCTCVTEGQHKAALATHAAQIEALTGLLTRAVGDISAALELADEASLISKWTADYVAAINEYDARAALGEPTDGGQHGTK